MELSSSKIKKKFLEMELSSLMELSELEKYKKPTLKKFLLFWEMELSSPKH